MTLEQMDRYDSAYPGSMFKSATGDYVRLDEVEAYARSLVPEVPEDVRMLASDILRQGMALARKNPQHLTEEIDEAALIITAFMEKQRSEMTQDAHEFSREIRLGRLVEGNFGTNGPTHTWKWTQNHKQAAEAIAARDASIRKEAEEKVKLKFYWRDDQVFVGSFRVARITKGSTSLITVTKYSADFRSYWVDSEAREQAETWANEFIASLSAEEGA